MQIPERCKYGYKQPCVLGWPGCICSDEMIDEALDYCEFNPTCKCIHCSKLKPRPND